MKRKYLFLYLMSMASFGLFSCAEDEVPTYPEDKDKVVEVPGNSDLNVGTDLFDLKQGTVKTQEIAEGAGEYKVWTLDNSVATASIEGNVVTVNGIAQGVTELMVSDKNGAYGSAKINVYLTDEVKLSQEEGEMTLLMGNPETLEFTVDLSNGGCKVSVSDEEKATAQIVDDKKVIVTGLAPTEEGAPVIITVEDSRGIKADFALTIYLQEGVFSKEEIEKIKAIREVTYSLNDNTISGDPLYGDDDIWFYESNVYGVIGNYKKYFYVKFDSPQTFDKVGVIEDAGSSLSAKHSSGISLRDEPTTFEVIKIEGNQVWATFYSITSSSTVKGYMVFEKQ